MTKKHVLYKEFLEIINQEIKYRSKANQVNFVLIWGASASGKTTLAKKLALSIADSAPISVDSYLTKSLLKKRFNHTPKNCKIPYIEGLDPKMWDLKLMSEDLIKLSHGETVKIPIYNYTSKERIGYALQEPKNIVILEGSYSMNNSISNTAILSILLQASLHDRLIRKIYRTVIINHRNDVDSAINRYLNQTQPSLKYYFNLYKERVDFIIENPLNPEEEFQKLATNQFELSGHYKLMTPKRNAGISKQIEQLRFYPSDNTLEYLVKNKKVFSVEIQGYTFKLLEKYYKTTLF